MLTREGCIQRRARLFTAVGEPCDLVIVGDPSHLMYFAGYAATPFEFRTAESAALLVIEPGRATLIGDDMLGPYLDRAHVDRVVAPEWYNGRTAAPYRRGLMVDHAVSALAELPCQRVGIELAAVPAGVVEGLRARRPGISLVDVGPTIRGMRRQKDHDELEQMRRSIRAGEAAHAAALREARPGMTELDMYQIVQRAAQESLGEAAIIYGDFVSGPRIATDRGGPPTSRVIEPGDLLVLDFSVNVDGYRGDFTNTFAVGGPPTQRQRELFEACRTALAAAESVLRSGAQARLVDQKVRASFHERGLDPYFTTHAGHGLGLGHPEPPYFVPESDETLMAGDVVAVEPGLYIPGTGGMRYERNYLITDNGFELLSHHAITIDHT